MKIIVFIISILVGIWAYKTKDLDGVKDAYLYRTSYALVYSKTIFFIAIDLLHLW